MQQMEKYIFKPCKGAVMPLTTKEQKAFNEMFQKIHDTYPDKKFFEKLADALFECTGNVNLRMRMFRMALKLKK